MPKSTFFNLPEEKRNRVIEAALDEFATYTYDKASITRIVNKAGIAKGSFYQYFEDKLDLFKHVVQIGGEKKLNCFLPIMAEMESKGFFQMLREMYVAGIEFHKAYPRLAKIGDDLLRSSNIELKREVMGTASQKGNPFMTNLIAKGIGSGEVDPGIDPEFIGMMLVDLTYSLAERYGMFGEEDIDAAKEYIDRMLHVLENGIKNRKQVVDSIHD